MFQDLDRQIAADARAVLEDRSGEGALGGFFGEFARDPGETGETMGQKKAVVGDLGDPPQPLCPMEEPLNRLRVEFKLGGELAHPRWPQFARLQQRLNRGILSAEQRNYFGQQGNYFA